MIDSGPNPVVTLVYLALGAIFSAIAFYTVPMIPRWFRKQRLNRTDRKISAVTRSLQGACPHFEITRVGVSERLAHTRTKNGSNWQCGICSKTFSANGKPDVVKAIGIDKLTSFDVVRAWVQAWEKTLKLQAQKRKLESVRAGIVNQESND